MRLPLTRSAIGLFALIAPAQAQPQSSPSSPQAVEESYNLRLPTSLPHQQATEAGPAIERWAYAYSAYQRGHYLNAFRIATLAAEKDHDASAMTLLGEFYADGLGIPKSDQKAYDWLKLAAERGDKNAVFALGMVYLRGQAGKERDLAAAARHFEKAANDGHVAAMYNLGLLYMSGQGVDSDPVRSAGWFAKAAEAGNADAQYAYANALREGVGVVRDMGKAMRWLEAAANQDLGEAQVDFAIALFNGAGIAKDETRAAALFKRAALRGNVVAQNRYARLLASGRALPQADREAAARWFYYARMQGLDDPWLDEFTARLPEDIRKNALATAQEWMRAKASI